MKPSRLLQLKYLIIMLSGTVLIEAQNSNNHTTLSANDIIAYDLQNAYASPQHQIYTTNSDGTGNTRLISGNDDLNHFNFSPDGNYLTTTGYVGGMNGNTWSIYIYNFSTNILKRITTTANVWDGDPAYSPDGLLITFTRTYPLQSGRNEIWVFNSDGTNLHYLGVQGFQPKFSPDGSKLAYASDVTGSWEIYTCNINGTGVQRITNNNSNEFAPDWSPDGNKLLFSSDRDGNSEIYVMTLDGTQMQRLTNNPAYDAQAKWSPDGTQIAFHSERLGTNILQIFVMNADGSNVRQVTNVVYPAQAINPCWKPRTVTSVEQTKKEEVPNGFHLYPNYPNPFNPTTTIRFELTHAMHIRLDLFDSIGRTIRTLVNDHKDPGTYSFLWDGTDQAGTQVASGIYLFRLTDGATIQQQKALLLK